MEGTKCRNFMRGGCEAGCEAGVRLVIAVPPFVVVHS